MGNSFHLIRIMVMAAFFAGLIIYLLGLVGGFFQASATFVLDGQLPETYIILPFPLFDIYPKLVLMVLPIPLFTVRLSPLTLIFLIFASSAVASTFLNKLRIALFCSISASLTATVQYFFVLPLVGGEPVGIFPIIPLPFLMLFVSKNLYLIILPAALFLVGVIVLLILSLQETVDRLSVTPTSSKYFKALVPISIDLLLVFVALLVFLLAAFLQVQILQAEFPQYPPLAPFARVYYYPMTIFQLIFRAWCLLILSLIISARTRVAYRLAENCVSVLARGLRKKKLIISFKEIMEMLGLELEYEQFRKMLNRASTIADKKGVLFFGVYGNYVFLKEPIVNILKEKLKGRGEADINEIAKEIEVDPKLLKNIYLKLRMGKLLGPMRISKNKIISDYTTEKHKPR